MRQVTVIIVFNENKDHVLMCLRQKDPYKGLYNFVGGKAEPDETILDCCYRELYEETNILREDIDLSLLMTFTYHQLNYELTVAYGVLKHSVVLKEEKHPLYWIDVNSNFEDRTRFAGDGNIQHMMDVLKYKEFNF